MHSNGVWWKWCCGQFVVGPAFLVFFSVQFCERGEEKYGGELTHWTPWQNDVDKYNYKFH